MKQLIILPFLMVASLQAVAADYPIAVMPEKVVSADDKSIGEIVSAYKVTATSYLIETKDKVSCSIDDSPSVFSLCLSLMGKNSIYIAIDASIKGGALHSRRTIPVYRLAGVSLEVGAIRLAKFAKDNDVEQD